MRTYPHHLTTDLPELPVPSLTESLERFRTATAAVTGPEGEAEVNQAIADFTLGHAPQLQRALEGYAANMAATGSNWMAEQWLETYLANREPLLLTANVTFQLNLPTAATGVDRIVELLQRIGAVHILQAKRATPEEINARGQRMSMDAWADFNGGIRTPTDDVDVWMRAGTGATYRTIGLLSSGRMWEVPLTGSQGKLLHEDHLRASVEYVLAQTEPAPQDFAGPSALGSAVLAQHAPWNTPENRSMYNRLANMLFTLTIDPHATPDISTLKRWAFHPGHAWVYKPISYLTALDNSMLAASLEHSVIDGGTLAAAVGRMQAVDVAALDTQHDPHLAEAHELNWHDTDFDLQDLRARSDALTAGHVVVRREVNLPFRVSTDAAAQLILMIAQQLTFGRIRAHYQSCDMRHFRAGRTETIRPVTIAAVNFVQALVVDEATQAQLTAALEAHRDWVKAAKSGAVFDRHLMMLDVIAQEMGGADAAIFAADQPAREDFLSTTTVGSDDQIVRYLFAPSAPDGFGVTYTPVAEGIEYALTWTDGTPKAEEFVASLKPAAELFYDFVTGIAPVTLEQ